MHLQWHDLYYPHMCLLLLGPSFILWGLFCTSCSNQLNNRYCTCLSPRTRCVSTHTWKHKSPPLEFLRPFHPETLYQLPKSQWKTILISFLKQTPPPHFPLNPPACISPRGNTEGRGQEAQDGPSESSVPSSQVTKREDISGKVLFALLQKTNLSQRQIVLLSTLSFTIKRKKLQGCKGPVPEENTHRETAFFNQV